MSNLLAFIKGILVNLLINWQLFGTMHFWSSYEGWHFVFQQGHEELRQEGKILDIFYATKYCISDIQNKFWFEYDLNELLQNEPNYHPKYFAFKAKIIVKSHHSHLQPKVRF